MLRDVEGAIPYNHFVHFHLNATVTCLNDDYETTNFLRIPCSLPAFLCSPLILLRCTEEKQVHRIFHGLFRHGNHHCGV